MNRRFFVTGFLTLIPLTFFTVPAVSQPPKDPTPPKLLQAPFKEADVKKARAEWAKFLKIPELKSIDLGKGVKLELVLIPPGVFKMGSPKGFKEDEVEHEVAIVQPFYMATTETTQAQFAAVTGTNPSWFQKGGGGEAKVKGMDTSKFPVERVAWYDSLMFCQKTGITGIRIPTEAEWEYACRAGTQTTYSFGVGITVKEANFEDELHRTAKVGSYAANAFGLFDMHGNVLEWCWDGYRFDYEKLPAINPVEERSNGRRMVRGGSFYGYAVDCRSANRFLFWDDFNYLDVGFRVVVMP